MPLVPSFPYWWSRLHNPCISLAARVIKCTIWFFTLRCGIREGPTPFLRGRYLPTPASYFWAPASSDRIKKSPKSRAVGWHPDKQRRRMSKRKHDLPSLKCQCEQDEHDQQYVHTDSWLTSNYSTSAFVQRFRLQIVQGKNVFFMDEKNIFEVTQRSQSQIIHLGLGK